MNRALPTIKETAGELQALLRKEKDAIRKDRLQLLYSIKTGLVSTRLQAASLLGKNRNTIGRWLAVYEREGIEALLSTHAPPGEGPVNNRGPAPKAGDRIGKSDRHAKKHNS